MSTQKFSSSSEETQAVQVHASATPSGSCQTQDQHGKPDDLFETRSEGYSISDEETSPPKSK
jgi:hypothetical protein